MKFSNVFIALILSCLTLISADSLDVSLVGRYTATSPEQMIVVGNRGLVANSSGGLQILDITNPSAIVELGYRFLPGSATGICALGDYVGIACSDSAFRILDPRDPSNILIIGEFFSDAPIYRCESRGDTIFLNGGKFRILDVSDPTSPSQIGEFDFVFDHLRFAVDGNYAYLAEKTYGLSVVDFSDPTAPANAERHYAFEEFVRGVAVDKWGRIFVAINTGIISMRWQSGSLEQIGFWPTDHPAHDITIDGRYAFVACGASGMRVLDISEPSAITEVGYYRLGSELTDIYLAYPLVWISGYWARINAMDVSPFASVAENNILPDKTTICAYPNPFNSSVVLRVKNKERIIENVEIFDLSGKRIASLPERNLICAVERNDLSIHWSPTNSISSGIFLVKTSFGDGTAITKRIVLMK